MIYRPGVGRFSLPEIAICSMAVAKVVKYLDSTSKGAPKLAAAMEFCVKAMQQALRNGPK